MPILERENQHKETWQSPKDFGFKLHKCESVGPSEFVDPWRECAEGNTTFFCGRKMATALLGKNQGALVQHGDGSSIKQPDCYMKPILSSTLLVRNQGGEPRGPHGHPPLRCSLVTGGETR